MRILYLSCHSVLEHDEVAMLNALGHYVFSPGAYMDPASPGDDMRPGLAVRYDDADIAADIAAYHAIPCEPGRDRKECLTAEFVDRFDVIIVMHMPHWITGQWDVLRRRTVVWRTIGQSIAPVEASLAPMRRDGMKIVRYSPRERTIPGYIGEDAVIRFYKDPDEFKGWTGHDEHVITFNQNLPERHAACNYHTWRQVVDGLPHKLYGPGNEDVGEANQGKVSFEALKAAMRDHRAYLYVGTHPASYTLNFLEAMCSGIPIVAVGPKLGNAYYFPGHDLYEIPDLITHGETGFYSDDVGELRGIIRMLLGNQELASDIGAAGREAAIRHFGKDTIWPQWQNFLETP